MVRDGVQKPPLGVWATVRENHGGGGEQWCWKTAARSVSHGFGKPCVEGERWWRTTAGQVENGAGEPGPGRRAMVSENQNQVAGQQRKAATIGARRGNTAVLDCATILHRLNTNRKRQCYVSPIECHVVNGTTVRSCFLVVVCVSLEPPGTRFLPRAWNVWERNYHDAFVFTGRQADKHLDWNSELFVRCIIIKVRHLRQVFDDYCQTQLMPCRTMRTF